MKSTSDATNTSGKTSSEAISNGAAFSVPIAVPKSPDQVAGEKNQRMLLVRLSDAADRIRKETELIQRTGFDDPAARLLRILAETVEEQRVSFGAARGDKK